MRSALEAISPTSRLLLQVESGAADVFSIGYAWTDKLLGELEGHTVVIALDAEAALASFRSQNRHIIRAWIIP